ncbi:hypothetical protein B0J11DRAFT_574803 [Dendryphion nanum]|uniref:Uncharacterized protein n=1 Tax=Dendryphion nanum TaxID=256645 RepID=A0A9P9J0G8_9PLEO|nr:hypothetical protein B0J11DRAFT_574803 [Dendryphion nanum]
MPARLMLGEELAKAYCVWQSKLASYSSDGHLSHAIDCYHFTKWYYIQYYLDIKIEESNETGDPMEIYDDGKYQPSSDGYSNFSKICKHRIHPINARFDDFCPFYAINIQIDFFRATSEAWDRYEGPYSRGGKAQIPESELQNFESPVVDHDSWSYVFAWMIDVFTSKSVNPSEWLKHTLEANTFVVIKNKQTQNWCEVYTTSDSDGNDDRFEFESQTGAVWTSIKAMGL